MPRLSAWVLMICGLWIFLAAPARPARGQTPLVQVLDARQAPLTELVDGNAISLKLTLPQAVSASTPVDFRLAGLEASVAGCAIPAGENACQTAAFPALGWAWDASGARQTQRVVQAQSAGQGLGESAALTIRPRPVVLVHGFNSNWETWTAYLGAEGYLAAHALAGYAVGDGQVAGALNTGGLAAPLARTNSIAQNAEILGAYIRNVQQATGAEQVDVVVHSMGGMITRYYLDRVMTTRNVAQLIILGTPMGGSSCAILPAALGLLLPATLEIQPSYMQGIFNPQITRRQGVPFHALAGTKLLESVQSPCTDVPSDLVVPVASVKAIPMPVREMALLHTDLNAAPEVFTEFVL
nr:alpha/beta fold hydrolase [Anaerolineales bacterium]